MTEEESDKYAKGLEDIIDKLVEKVNSRGARGDRLAKRLERFAHRQDALDGWVADEIRAAISEFRAGKHGDQQ